MGQTLKPKVHCYHCGNDWPPKVPNPLECPRCHNRRWYVPRSEAMAMQSGGSGSSGGGNAPGGGNRHGGGNGGDNPGSYNMLPPVYSMMSSVMIEMLSAELAHRPQERVF